MRNLACGLRAGGFDVYDFTDAACRTTPEIPPERFPETFDPTKHVYADYINRPEWRAAVFENKRAIEQSDLVVLVLPCGNDAHADWAYGVALGKRPVVVGQPRPGERSPVHLWADAILAGEVQPDAVIGWIKTATKTPEPSEAVHTVHA